MIRLDLNPPGTLARLSIGHGRGDATYRDINEHAAARIHAAQDLRGLRIDAPTMPRPRQLLDLLSHLPALAEAAERIRRIAVLSDSPPREFLPVLRGHFGACEVRHFAAAASRAADQWLDNAEVAPSTEPRPQPAIATPELEELAAADELVQADDAIVLDDADSAVDEDIDDWFVKS